MHTRELICQLAIASLVLIVPQQLVGQSSELGIYRADGEEGEVKVRRNDGGDIYLKELIQQEFGQGEIRSISNSNQLFTLSLSFDPSLKSQLNHRPLVLGFQNDFLLVGSRGEYDGKFTLNAQIYGEQAARRIAGHLGIEPMLRAHPGYNITTDWIPVKDEYAIGEEIELRLIIKNIGDRPLAFMDGGKQRGARNNQFQFIAFRHHGYGTAVPDTGDPTNFGGIAAARTIEPGETFEKRISINDWFEFTEADTYRITGIFELGVVDDEWNEIWLDYAVGSCMVVIGESQ